MPMKSVKSDLTISLRDKQNSFIIAWAYLLGLLSQCSRITTNKIIEKFFF
jgi:hypothetical protein